MYSGINFHHNLPHREFGLQPVRDTKSFPTTNPQDSSHLTRKLSTKRFPKHLSCGAMAKKTSTRFDFKLHRTQSILAPNLQLRTSLYQREFPH